MKQSSRQPSQRSQDRRRCFCCWVISIQASARSPSIHSLEVRNLRAQVRLARCRVPTASLGENGLPLGSPKSDSQGSKSDGHVVRDALGVRAAVVRVEVLVDVKNQVGGRAIEVLDG